MERYESYKNSKIEWIDQIPSHWNNARFAKVNWIRARLGWKGLKADEYVDTGYPLLSAFNIVNNHLTWASLNYINKGRYDESPEIKLSVGDLLLVKDGAGIGKCARVDELPKGEATVNSSIGVITPIERVDYKFEYYYLLSPIFQNIIARLRNGMGVPHLTQEAMKEISIPLPPVTEQSAIAAFLDNQCAQIDSIIEEANLSIEEYKKWKASIIFEAVTKGINSNVDMRDSGIAWFGLLPTNWDIRPIKQCFSIFSGATPKSDVKEYWNGEVVWITPADYKTDDKYVTQGKKTLSKAGYESCGVTIVPAGSVIFSKRAPVGTVAISTVPLCTNQGCLSCVPQKGIISEYFYYVMSVLSEQFELFSSGTTFKEISATTFSEFKLPCPPEDEQLSIAAFLSRKCDDIDALIKEKKELIHDLVTYKQSLIYEAVTGKRKVV